MSLPLCCRSLGAWVSVYDVGVSGGTEVVTEDLSQESYPKVARHMSENLPLAIPASSAIAA